MSARTGPLRVRALVSSWFAVFAVLCLVLAGVGGWAVYTVHVDPGSTVEQRQQTHWRVTGAFDHSAEVTRENPAFETGETLRNRSTYFVGASPVLDGRFVARYAGTGGEAASITLDPVLVIRAVDGETVFWSNRTSLADPTTATVAAGERVATSFSLNATEVANRRTAIQNALGASPGEVETFVAVNVAVEGRVDGQPATLSFTHRLPLSVGDSAYSVGPPAAGRETMTTAESVTVPRTYGVFWAAGGPLLAVLGLLGLAGLVVGRRRGAFELSEAERDLLAYRDERGEFDEWVVRMRLTDELRDRPRAEAESLGDLVDFAIDSDTGVVEDPETGNFAVVTDGLFAVYEPPEIARDPSLRGASIQPFAAANDTEQETSASAADAPAEQPQDAEETDRSSVEPPDE